MIIGLGTDIVLLKRFYSFIEFSRIQLTKVYTSQEYEHYTKLKTDKQKIEFLGSRFAVKEAFYKALCQSLQHQHILSNLPLFMPVARSCEIQYSHRGLPQLTYYSTYYPELHFLQKCLFHVSLSHEKDIAQAVVIIEQI